MVSTAPNSQSYDMRHMWDFQSSLKSQQNVGWNIRNVPENTILWALYNQPDFSNFLKITKIANMENVFADSQFNSTLFVPSDKHIARIYNNKYFEDMDIGTAKQLIKFCTLRNKINKNLLQSSPSSFFPTADRSNKLHVTNINNITSLPNNTNVIHFNYNLSNGLIHVVDNILYAPSVIFT